VGSTLYADRRPPVFGRRELYDVRSADTSTAVVTRPLDGCSPRSDIPLCAISRGGIASSATAAAATADTALRPLTCSAAVMTPCPRRITKEQTKGLRI